MYEIVKILNNFLNIIKMASYNVSTCIASYQTSVASGQYRTAYSLHHMLRLGDRPASPYVSLNSGWVDHFFDQQCHVCGIDGFEGGAGTLNQPYFLGCGDPFHKRCIVTWFETSLTCPLCRPYCHWGLLIYPYTVAFY